jgi:hypothetical protein
VKWSDIPQFLHGGNYGADVELHYLHRWLDGARETGLDLDPPYQRGHVWSEDQRVKYVEYLLSGGVSHRTILWNCPNWTGGKQPHCDLSDNIEIVDGKQRLTAVLKFVDDEIPAFGHRYSEFEGNPRIMQGRLKMKVNNLQTRKEVLTWYLQTNDGGVVHSAEELERVRGLLAKEQSGAA